MKKVKLFNFMISRIFLTILLISLVFYAVFSAFMKNRIEEEARDFLNMTRLAIENSIDAYMKSISGYEIFFEQAMDHLMDKIEKEATSTDLETLKETVESLLEEFNPKLLEEELIGVDYSIFDSKGKIVVPGRISKTDLDDYTLKVLEDLKPGEKMFERLDDVQDFNGKDVFVKIGYLRISEDLILEIRVFIDWKGIKDVLEVIASLPSKSKIVSDVGMYTYSGETFGRLFKPLEEDLKGAFEKAVHTMKPLRIVRDGVFDYIIPKTLPKLHERQFSKPFVLVIELNLADIRRWSKTVSVFTASLIGLSLILLMLFVRGIVKEISSALENLVDTMENFRKTRLFVPSRETVDSKIEEIQNLLEHFQDMAEDLTAHMQELEAMNEELESSYRQLENAHRELEEAHMMFSKQLSIIAEGYDENTGNHIVRVGELSAFIAEKLGLEEDFVSRIRHYAPLHDIGKLLIPREILNKKGRLTDEEFEVMKKHTIYGAMLLEGIPRFEMARRIALYHHEKYDGTGYPFGLKGDEIPIEAQIVALVDVYDALRSERPYKKAFSHDKALEIILEGDERTRPENFNPEILDIIRRFSDEIEELWREVKERDSLLEERMKKLSREIV